jgi:monoamine oxidase
VFYAPTRGLIGYQGELLTDTRGTAIMNRIFHGYANYKGEIQGRRNGVLISNDQGDAVAYAMFKLEDRGPMMIEPGWKVYRGMIVGEHTRDNDLEINVLKGKQLTNIRTTSKDEAVRLTPPIRMTLEKALAYIEEDELVEVTPKSIRLRKKHLDPNDRKRAEKDTEAVASSTADAQMESVDVAIIGAGAAGLGAANVLKDSGLSTLVLEARDRLGGRAHTVQAAPDVTFDVGCGWLHSADKNSFVPIAGQLNFEINKNLPPWRERAYGQAFPQADRDEFVRALDAYYDRIEAAARGGKDSPANLYLEPGNRWNSMIDAISTYVNGCELDQVSILDFDRYEDTDHNWRIRRGYGALVAAYGAGVPVALNCAVTLIDHSGPRVRLETSRGTLEAGKVIITVPTNLIADETIRFSPALPDKLDAARGLPLGLADKVTLALADPEALPTEGNLRGATMRTEMGTYHIRPFGQPCIEGFFGGRFARQLEDAGDGAIAAHSIDEIVDFLGNDYRRKLKPLSESHWAQEPFSRGSYSHALPGHAGDRAVLAAPVDGRLFFAGEATSPNFFSTAHGARDSGERAAQEVLIAAARK